MQVKRVPSLGSQALRPAWHGSGQVMQEAGTGMSDRDMLGAGMHLCALGRLGAPDWHPHPGSACS